MKRVFLIFGHIYQDHTSMYSDNEYRHAGSLTLDTIEMPEEKFVSHAVKHLKKLIKAGKLQKELVKSESFKNSGTASTFTYRFTYLKGEASKKLIAKLEKELLGRLSEIFKK